VARSRANFTFTFLHSGRGLGRHAETHRSKDCRWVTAWSVRRLCPRRFLLAKCQTVSRYTSRCDFIYIQTTKMFSDVHATNAKRHEQKFICDPKWSSPWHDFHETRAAGRLSVKNSCAECYKNSTNGFFTYIRSRARQGWTDGQTDGRGAPPPKERLFYYSAKSLEGDIVVHSESLSHTMWLL
jgi:hypothetical protein